jgi:hypothetical protein
MAWVRAFIAVARATRNERIISTCPIAGLGDAALLGLDRAGGRLSVQRIRLATPAPRRPVGAVDLHHHLAVGAQEPGQPGPEAAGALDAPGVDLAQALRPGQQLGVAGQGGRHAGGVQAPPEAVGGHRDVDVGVGIDANRDLGGRWLCHRVLAASLPVVVDGTHRPGGRTRLRWVCGDRLL